MRRPCHVAETHLTFHTVLDSAASYSIAAALLAAWGASVRISGEYTSLSRLFMLSPSCHPLIPIHVQPAVATEYVRPATDPRCKCWASMHVDWSNRSSSTVVRWVIPYQCLRSRSSFCLPFFLVHDNFADDFQVSPSWTGIPCLWCVVIVIPYPFLLRPLS